MEYAEARKDAESMGMTVYYVFLLKKGQRGLLIQPRK